MLDHNPANILGSSHIQLHNDLRVCVCDDKFYPRSPYIVHGLLCPALALLQQRYTNMVQWGIWSLQWVDLWYTMLMPNVHSS